MLTGYFGNFCFIVFGIFLSPHMIPLFLPSSIYFAIPPIPKIAKKEALHPGSGLLLTVTPERPFVIIILELLKQHIKYLGLDGRKGIGCGVGSLPNFHS